MAVRLILAYLKRLGVNFTKPTPNVLEQAKALASAASPIKRASEPNAKPIRLKRPSYADSQMEWEWAHNKRAQQIMERAKSGFF